MVLMLGSHKKRRDERERRAVAVMTAVMDNRKRKVGLFLEGELPAVAAAVEAIRRSETPRQLRKALRAMIPAEPYVLALSDDPEEQRAIWLQVEMLWYDTAFDAATRLIARHTDSAPDEARLAYMEATADMCAEQHPRSGDSGPSRSSEPWEQKVEDLIAALNVVFPEPSMVHSSPLSNQTVAAGDVVQTIYEELLRNESDETGLPMFTYYELEALRELARQHLSEDSSDQPALVLLEAVDRELEYRA